MRSLLFISRVALPIIALATLVNCGGHNASPPGVPDDMKRGQAATETAPTSSPIPISDPLKGDHPGARLSSSKSPASFASMVGKSISVSDIDRFIDPSVVGVNRPLAEQLMESMPSNMRGDFVYIRKDGTILSNRPQFAQGIVRENFTLPGEESRSSRMRESITPSQGSDIGTGPYVREQSLNGLTAVMATVTLVCNDEAFVIGPGGYPDNGFAYSGGSGYNGSSIDAGLQYNPDGGIQPFISYSVGAQWTNQQQHYYCNSQTTGNYGTIGVFFGDMSSGTLLFLATGLPENPPPQSSPWGAQTTWDDAAWVYFDSPGDWYEPGTDAVGQPTPCYSCTVKRITSIGQKGGENFYDNSCFGGCGSGTYYAGVHWGSVKMGEIVSPCPVQPGAPATECTISGFDDGRWYGSLVDFNGGNNNAIEISGGSEETTYASEGINLDPTLTFSPDATITYSCTFNQLEQYGKCGLSSTNNSTYTTPPSATVDSTHPISINLTSMSNQGSCGDPLSYTVSLINPSGSTVYSSATQTGATFSTSYSASAATGSWKWVVHANNQSGACAGNIY